jgi:hypothetical protein
MAQAARASDQELRVSPYQTHQPLLFACARHAIDNGGDVIELGCGMHSTPQLTALFGSAFRSYETNKDWATMIRRFGSQVVDVETYDDVPVRPYAMVFIDNAPEERRVIDLARFVDSKLVVVHDSDPQYSSAYGLERSLALYPFRCDYIFASPNTTVVSRDADAMAWVRKRFGA